MKKRKEPLETIELRLPPWQLAVLEIRANRIGISLEQFIVYALIRHMDEQLNSASSSSSSEAPR